MGHDLGMRSRVHPKYKTKYRVSNWAESTRPSLKRSSAGGDGSSSSRGVGSNRFMKLPRPKASPIAMWLT
jgi:hypothetical protein